MSERLVRKGSIRDELRSYLVELEWYTEKIKNTEHDEHDKRDYFVRALLEYLGRLPVLLENNYENE